MKKHKSETIVNDLTPKQRTALESLTNNKNIVIITPDKNSSIGVLDKVEYDKACLNIILDTSYYEELNENPNTSYK